MCEVITCREIIIIGFNGIANHRLIGLVVLLLDVENGKNKLTIIDFNSIQIFTAHDEGNC